MVKGRGCAYYKSQLSNYLSANERSLWRVSVLSVQQFVILDGDTKQFPVYVAFEDWNGHVKLQTLLYQCYRLRMIDIYILYWNEKSIGVNDTIKRLVDNNPKQWSTVFAVYPLDDYHNMTAFQQNNRIPSLFLYLDSMTLNIDDDVLKVLETYTYEEIVMQLSKYCTNNNFNQLVNVCLQLQKPVDQTPSGSWQRYSQLKTALIDLDILQRVQIRPDGDHKLLKLVLSY